MTNTLPRRKASFRDLKQRNFEKNGRIDLEDGISLYRRHNSPFIWADYRLPNGRKRQSTKVREDVSLAEQVARRTYKELAHRSANGQPIATSGPSVGDLLRAYERTVEQEITAGNKALKPRLSVLRKNLIPFWDRVSLSGLNRQSFYAWERWRRERPIEEVVREYDRQGKKVVNTCTTKVPSAATLSREKTHFLSALAWGSDQEEPWVSDEVVHEIRHLPRRQKLTKKRANSDRRQALTQDQVEALFREFSRWESIERARAVRPGGKPRNYDRRLMAHHARLMLTSGLRPGVEITDLTWGDIRLVTLQTGEQIIVIDSCGNGKTGPRAVNCQPEAVQVISDLRALLTEFGYGTKPNDPLWPGRKGGIVRDFNGSFKRVMKKLAFPIQVSEEPLYMLRHTYFTERLAAGVSSDILATNCGTSVEMIERHYKHLSSERIREKLNPRAPVKPAVLKLAPPSPGSPRLVLQA
jgi:integrase